MKAFTTLFNASRGLLRSTLVVSVMSGCAASASQSAEELEAESALDDSAQVTDAKLLAPRIISVPLCTFEIAKFVQEGIDVIAARKAGLAGCPDITVVIVGNMNRIE